MRYIGVDDIVFEDKDGVATTVKDMREIGVYTKGFTLQMPARAMLDEIACKRSVYGEGSEDLSYAIFDFNIEKIMENNFDLTRMKQIDIPLIDQV